MIVAALLSVAIANLLVGLIVFLRKSSSPLHHSFLLLTMGVAGWCAGIAVFLTPTITGNIIYYINMYYAAALLIATALYGFTHALLSKTVNSTGNVIGILAIPIVFLVLTWFIPNLVLAVEDASRHVTISALPYLLYGLVFSVIFVTACVQLFRYASGKRGRRYRLVSISILLAGIIGVLFNLILPALGNYRLIWVGPVGSILLVIALMYSITQGKLFDIRGAIARVTAYALSVILIGTGLGGVAALLIGNLGLKGAALQWTVIIATVIATLIYPYVKAFFDTVTEQVFFQKPYNTQEAIDTITGLMVQVTTIDELLKKIAASLQGFVGAESVTVTLTEGTAAQRTAYTTRDKESSLTVPVLTQAFMLAHEQRVLVIDDVIDEAIGDELSGVSIAMVSQLRSQTGLVGYVLFGYKQNGSSYTKRDTDFIDIVSDEFALAIQNMLRFQEIAEFNTELQHRIDEATSELRVSNKKLHDLDRSKDEFISMASHQLRTPLTAVKGYISMVLEGDVGSISDEQRQVLGQAYESSQRMVFLIGDFLNVSRLQTGKFELELSNINLADLAKEEVEQLTDTARSRQVTIQYKKPAALQVIKGDENKLRQVMMNFIDNAIFYSPPESVVEVRVYKEAGGIVFKVTDSGIGVPKTEQPKLFTKFFRASNARKQRPDGTGIGLYMAKKVVIAHGGTVVFESKVGSGSTFGFRLPLENNAK
jgi:signal transduction histidine kinase